MNLLKKWWFWVLFILVLIVIIPIMITYANQKVHEAYMETYTECKEREESQSYDVDSVLERFQRRGYLNSYNQVVECRDNPNGCVNTCASGCMQHPKLTGFQNFIMFYFSGGKYTKNPSGTCDAACRLVCMYPNRIEGIGI